MLNKTKIFYVYVKVSPGVVLVPILTSIFVVPIVVLILICLIRLKNEHRRKSSCIKSTRNFEGRRRKVARFAELSLYTLDEEKSPGLSSFIRARSSRRRTKSPSIRGPGARPGSQHRPPLSKHEEPVKTVATVVEDQPNNEPHTVHCHHQSQSSNSPELSISNNTKPTNSLDPLAGDQGSNIEISCNQSGRHAYCNVHVQQNCVKQSEQRTSALVEPDLHFSLVQETNNVQPLQLLNTIPTEVLENSDPSEEISISVPSKELDSSVPSKVYVNSLPCKVCQNIVLPEKLEQPVSSISLGLVFPEVFDNNIPPEPFQVHTELGQIKQHFYDHDPIDPFPITGKLEKKEYLDLKDRGKNDHELKELSTQQNMNSNILVCDNKLTSKSTSFLIDEESYIGKLDRTVGPLKKIKSGSQPIYTSCLKIESDKHALLSNNVTTMFSKQNVKVKHFGLNNINTNRIQFSSEHEIPHSCTCFATTDYCDPSPILSSPSLISSSLSGHSLKPNSITHRILKSRDPFIKTCDDFYLSQMTSIPFLRRKEKKEEKFASYNNLYSPPSSLQSPSPSSPPSIPTPQALSSEQSPSLLQLPTSLPPSPSSGLSKESSNQQFCDNNKKLSDNSSRTIKDCYFSDECIGSSLLSSDFHISGQRNLPKKDQKRRVKRDFMKGLRNIRRNSSLSELKCNCSYDELGLTKLNPEFFSNISNYRSLESKDFPHLKFSHQNLISFDRKPNSESQKSSLRLDLYDIDLGLNNDHLGRNNDHLSVNNKSLNNPFLKPQEQNSSLLDPQEPNSSLLGPQELNSNFIKPQEQNSSFLVPQEQSFSLLDPQEQNFSLLDPQELNYSSLEQQELNSKFLEPQEQNSSLLVPQEQNSSLLEPQDLNSSFLEPEEQNFECESFPLVLCKGNTPTIV